MPVAQGWLLLNRRNKVRFSLKAHRVFHLRRNILFPVLCQRRPSNDVSVSTRGLLGHSIKFTAAHIPRLNLPGSKVLERSFSIWIVVAFAKLALSMIGFSFCRNLLSLLINLRRRPVVYTVD